MCRELEIINLEMYQEPSGEILIKPIEESVFLLEEKRRDFIVPMKSILMNDYPTAWKACKEWNRKSRHNITLFDFLNVRRFCICNFQKYDGELDVDANGFMHFEFTSCTMRVECKYQNIICNPTFNNKLTNNDLDILRMIVTQHMTSDQIALSLGRSVNTINNRRKTIQKKTGCNTIAKLVAYWYEHRLK